MSFQSWGYIACLAAMPPPWHNQHKTTFPDQSTTLLTNRAAGLSCPPVINLVFQHWSFSNQTKILLQEDYEKARVARVEVERAWIRARRPGPNFWLAINKSQAGGLTSLISWNALSKLKLEFCTFISKKLGLKGNWGKSGLVQTQDSKL